MTIAQHRAIYKGVGTINGEGEYKFLLSAIDGDLQGRSDDTFRIRIWLEDETDGTEFVIYDNQVNADSMDADPVDAIEGGSIVIHKGK